VEREGYRALAVWPMTSEEEVIAGVCCYYDAPRTWTQPEKEVFQTFTWQAVSALKNAWLYEAQAERRFELEALYELGSRLRAANTAEEIFSMLVDHAGRLLRAEHAALSLLDADHQTFTCVQAIGGAPDAKDSITPAARPILNRVAQTRQPHVTEDIGREPRPGQAGGLPTPSCPIGPVIVVALQSEREVIGTLAVGRAKGKNPRPFTPTEVRLLQGIAEMGGTAISRARLFHNLEDAYIQMVLALARAMDARDAYTGNHSERLAMLADSVARAMGLPDEEVKDIRWAALLHDIGKIGSPDDILSKPGRLTEREREIMRLHPTVGEGILLPVARMAGVARIVRHHQEKWDGTGYPDGLRGEAIPLGARILAVVDAYGAITDERPYKTPGTRAKAEAEIKRCAGTQFDPRVVDVFCQLLDRKEKETTLEFAGLSTRA
jgi:putative nucleotidyltransferase with HDIG domain